MTKRCLTMLGALLLIGNAAVAEETVEEFLRERGVGEVKIERMLELLEETGSRERIEKGLNQVPYTPSVDEYLMGGLGESNERELAKHAAQDLELARAVLLRGEMRDESWPDIVVLQALGVAPRMGQPIPDILELLEQAAPLYPPLDPNGRYDRRWKEIRLTWATAFWKLHGKQAYDLARQAVSDPERSAEERALHLLVFMYAGVYDRDFRSLAFEVYRPYLRSPEPELQRVAVLISRYLGDYQALSDLKDVALYSRDPKARLLAFYQVKNLLRRGPERWKKGIYDVEGFRHWIEVVQPEWEREQRRLVTGKETGDDPVVSERTSAPDGSAGTREIRGTAPSSE
jgi:hypothetical protein